MNENLNFFSSLTQYMQFLSQYAFFTPNKFELLVEGIRALATQHIIIGMSVMRCYEHNLCLDGSPDFIDKQWQHLFCDTDASNSKDMLTEAWYAVAKEISEIAKTDVERVLDLYGGMMPSVVDLIRKYDPQWSPNTKPVVAHYNDVNELKEIPWVKTLTAYLRIASSEPRHEDHSYGFSQKHSMFPLERQAVPFREDALISQLDCTPKLKKSVEIDVEAASTELPFMQEYIPRRPRYLSAKRGLTGRDAMLMAIEEMHAYNLLRGCFSPQSASVPAVSQGKTSQVCDIAQRQKQAQELAREKRRQSSRLIRQEVIKLQEAQAERDKIAAREEKVKIAQQQQRLFAQKQQIQVARGQSKAALLQIMHNVRLAYFQCRPFLREIPHHQLGGHRISEIRLQNGGIVRMGFARPQTLETDNANNTFYIECSYRDNTMTYALQDNDTLLVANIPVELHAFDPCHSALSDLTPLLKTDGGISLYFERARAANPHQASAVVSLPRSFPVAPQPAAVVTEGADKLSCQRYGL